MNNTTSTTRLKLDHHFNDNPIKRSKLGSAQQLRPGERRSHADSQAHTKSIFQRLINRLFIPLAIVLNPNGQRAIHRYNSHLEKVSDTVDYLLLALQKTNSHSVDGISALNIIAQIPKDLVALKNPSLSNTQIIKTRVKASLQHMSDLDLNALREGLLLAKKSELKRNPDCAQYLNLIDHQLKLEIDFRLEKKSAPFQQLIANGVAAAVKTDDESATQVDAFYTQLCALADQQIEADGAPISSLEEKQKHRSSVLVSSFEHFLNGSNDPQQAAGEMGKFLSFLSSENLKNLDAEGLFQEDIFTMQRMVSGMSAIFSQRREENWIYGAQIILMTAKKSSAQLLVGDFSELAILQENLDAHNRLWGAPAKSASQAESKQKNGTKPDAEIDGATQESRQEMQALRDDLSEKLAADLAALSLTSGQAKALQAAAQTLQLTLPPAALENLRVSAAQNG